MLRGRRSGVRILIGETDFSLLQNVQTGSETHPASYSNDKGVVYQGHSGMGCEVDHSPRTSVDVSNECSHAGTRSVCLRDVDKENFTSFLPDNGRRLNTHIRHCTECWMVFGFASSCSGSAIRSKVFTAWKTRSCCIKEAAGRSNTGITRRRRFQTQQHSYSMLQRFLEESTGPTEKVESSGRP